MAYLGYIGYGRFSSLHDQRHIHVHNPFNDIGRGDLLNVGKTSVCQTMHKIALMIFEELRAEYIQFPIAICFQLRFDCRYGIIIVVCSVLHNFGIRRGQCRNASCY